MKLVFVDTNYFVRLIENDVEDQMIEVKELFELAVAGKVKLCSSVIVLFEIYWLLKSFYNKSGVELREILIKLIEMSYVEWQDREVLREAVGKMLKHRDDLEDVYNVCWARKMKVKQLASFDQKLQKHWKKK